MRRAVRRQGRGRRDAAGSSSAGDARDAAALSCDGNHHARSRVRGQPAGPLEPPLLYDRQRGPRRRCPRRSDEPGARSRARERLRHGARKEPSGTFVLSNPQKAIDYAYRAVHVTAETAKKIATDYYSQPIRFSYWSSCSNGGRQGLLEAQRFPDDFDGIVANAPWVDQTGFTIGAMWNQKAITDAPIPPSKLPLVAGKVMTA